MELRYSHIADYVSQGAHGKILIIGIFDQVYDSLKVRPISIPPCWFVAQFAASVIEGTEHQFMMRIMNEDGKQVLAPVNMPFRLSPTAPGKPLKGFVVLNMNGLKVPELGDYDLEIFVDGSKIGLTSLTVLDPPGEG